MGPFILSLLAAQSMSQVAPPRPRVQTLPAPGMAAQVPTAQKSSPAFASIEAPFDQRNKYQPGNVIVSFEGGVVGRDLGSALLKLARAPNLLKTEPHQVGDGDSPCSIMVGLGYPKPCSEGLLKALDLLNPKLTPSRGHLHTGDILLLPDAWIRPYRTGRVFSRTLAKEQRRSTTIQKGWAHLNLDVTKMAAVGERVDFDAFDLIIPTQDAGRQAEILKRVAPLKSANVRLNSVPFKGAAAAAYSTEDPATYQQQCSQVPPVVPQTIDYRQYADFDADAAALVSQRPPGSQPAQVYLLDVAIDPSPNLDGAVAGTAAASHPAWHCSWASGSDPLHHSTHLAGIIASRRNGYGFVGLSPTATIISYELLAPSNEAVGTLDVPPGRDTELADYLLDKVDQNSPQVFLVATTVPYEAEFHAKDQIDPIRRFDRPLEHNIQELQPLFVVAAGQGAQSLGLSPRTAMSPQNLGDLRNVIVVTACDNCSRAAPTLLQGANYSIEGGNDVQVAAPGGQPILGWVDHQSVGAAKGTSEAAAFVAGVVAEMIGRWHQQYVLSESVKKRLQVTSWPLFPRMGAPSDDSAHVATGIVDPLLALLDPSVTWIKDTSGWHQVQLRGFSSDTLVLKQITGTPDWIAAKSVARIVRVSAPEEPASYVIYSDAVRRTGHSERLGDVMKDGPLTADPQLKIIPCNGPPIPLSGVTDLIVSNRGLTGQQCG